MLLKQLVMVGMDIRLYITWILIIMYTPHTAHGLDAYLCGWPVWEVTQLRCDYLNCPYMSIDHITVGRLDGDIGQCRELQINNTEPLKSCIYKLTETNDETNQFLMQVKANCTRKEVCEIYASPKFLFTSAGNCGYESGQQSLIRNWIHIEYSCRGDVPGLKCIGRDRSPPSTVSPTEERATSVTTTEGSSNNKTIGQIRPATPSSKGTESSPNRIIQLVIPILATLLFLTLILIIATVLYRHKIKRNNAWRKAVEMRLKQRAGREQALSKEKPDLNKYKLDTAKLKDLEKRLTSDHVKANNDYVHDMSFGNLALNRSDDGLERLNQARRHRRSSMDHQNNLNAMDCAEQYFSDSSVSTTTLEDCDFDSQGRRKKKRTPHAPLPKPVVRHSEVYFTETETESEAPKIRSKDIIPKVDPPPKQHRDRPRYERPRQHNKAASLNDITTASTSNNRNSLDLALTKLAAKKLTAHDQRIKPAGKKPMAGPRSERPTSATYGLDTHTYPANLRLDYGLDDRRINTLTPGVNNSVYRNI